MGRWNAWLRQGRCRHVSHRSRLRCWRPQTYDRFCAKHNSTCFNSCFHEDDEPDQTDVSHT